MCGIAGVVSLISPLSENLVSQGRAMRDILRHRGPDAEGEFFDQNCYLGNTRLKIMDTSSQANLPFLNENGSVILCYNGEVTNFQELKEEFKLAEKYRFNTTSDTEVVLRLYEELGIAFLQHLSGVFAFTLYDKRAQKVYIVRDQFGCRPLFYLQNSDTLYFASEIKSFLDLDVFSAELDREAIFNYFSLIYIPGEQTPFKQIRELDGGHFIEVDLQTNKTKVKQYFQIKYSPSKLMSEQEAIDGFYEVMEDSVRRNLIADAPLGMTLSGGIDSSSMLGIAKKLGKSEEIHTFSLKINEPSFDESKYQHIMSEYAKSIHHEVVIEPEAALNVLREQMACMDEPNGNGAVIPSYLLAQEAKKHVKVLLSGEGGDEITNGYDTHLAFNLRNSYRKYVPKPLRKVAYWGAHALPLSFDKISFEFMAKRFTEGAELSAPKAHLYWRYVFNEKEKGLLLSPSFYKGLPTDEMFEQMYNNSSFEEGLDKISLIDWKYFFIGDLMVKNDRTFMANSIEARFPFADKKVFDFAATIPAKYRIKGLTARYVEKEAMKRVLPKEISQRSSFGLEMPHSMWVSKGFSKVFEKYFTENNLKKAEIFNYSHVRYMWETQKAGKYDYGRALWAILNYLIWLELFVQSSDYKKYLNH